MSYSSLNSTKYKGTAQSPYGEINACIKIQPTQHIPLYQKLSQKAKQLRLLDMTYPQIAKALKTGKNTVKKACEQKRNGVMFWPFSIYPENLPTGIRKQPNA